MKKADKLVKILLISITMIFISIYPVQATVDTSKFNPSKSGLTSSDVSIVTNVVNPIIGTIKTVGVVISVIMLIVIGLKYMTGSISEKAEYKKSMIPYLIGAIMIVTITQLVGLIASMVTAIK